VTAARLRQASSEERDSLISSAKRYFRLARELLLPVNPAVICIGGLSGTGKSVLAHSLAPLIAPLPGALILRSDVERKAMFGFAETQRLSTSAYTPQISAKLYNSLTEKAVRIAASGYSVIVDAVFSKPAEREAVSEAVRTAGLEFAGLFLKADLAARLSRVSRRTADASDADAAIAHEQETYDLGMLDWPGVDASGTPVQTLENAKAALPKRFLGNEYSRPD
jgi:predicted kinase